MDNSQFKFGIESEYLLVNANTYEPMWYKDITFNQLHDLLATISLTNIPDLTGLRLEAPHRKLMPYVVEGYGIVDEEFNVIDIMPKGVEIRTPVCDSVEQCISTLEILYERLQIALHEINLQAVALSHHPMEKHFEAKQNKKRHDYWQWAMQAMLTYGPDINISLPQELSAKLDLKDLEAKIDYYAPALAALSVASPFYCGKLWEVNGKVGKSYRTYKRSIVGPAVEFHPDQNFRLEFKSFDMTNSPSDFRNYTLLFLALLLDDELMGRSDKATRIYELGAVAVDGLEAPGVKQKLHSIFKRAAKVLGEWGFSSVSLREMEARLNSGKTPADLMIAEYKSSQGSIPSVLKKRSKQMMAA